MVSEETLARLWWHAGLPVAALPAAQRYEGLVPSVDQATDYGRGSIEDVERALADFLQTLSVLNKELNGPVPSQRGSPGPRMLPSDVVSAVNSAILRVLYWEEYAKRAGKRVPPFAWRAQMAWCAVLDGDIDDLDEHIRLEEMVFP